MARLTFEINGPKREVAFDTFTRATSNVVAILKELDRAISRRKGRGTLVWYVYDLSMNGNLLIEVESKVRARAGTVHGEAVQDISRDVTNSLVTGFENVESRGISPPYLSESGLKKIQQMAALVRKNGARAFTAKADDRSAEISQKAADNISQLLPARRESIGAVEGRLEGISIHGPNPKFVVYHAITHKAINCVFAEPKFLDEAIGALGKRVYVAGTLKKNIRGEPVAVDVQKVRILGMGSLPSTGELTGYDPDFTGDLNTEEFIRRIRRA
jgi:hypothetical protein